MLFEITSSQNFWGVTAFFLSIRWCSTIVLMLEHRRSSTWTRGHADGLLRPRSEPRQMHQRQGLRVSDHVSPSSATALVPIPRLDGPHKHNHKCEGRENEIEWRQGWTLRGLCREAWCTSSGRKRKGRRLRWKKSGKYESGRERGAVVIATARHPPSILLCLYISAWAIAPS